jgi:hypothetical protein
LLAAPPVLSYGLLIVGSDPHAASSEEEHSRLGNLVAQTESMVPAMRLLADLVRDVRFALANSRRIDSLP